MSDVIRRQPKQARSQQRVNDILDAAAALFAEIGYEAATTNAIAARANTRIGSLYHFFPNKEAILEALAERFRSDLRAAFDQAFDLAFVQTQPLEVVLDRVVETFAAFDASHIGFDQVFAGSPGPAHLGVVSEELHREVIARVTLMIQGAFPALDAERCARTAVVSVAAVKGVMPVAMAAEGQARAVLLAELKRLLVLYVRAAGEL